MRIAAALVLLPTLAAAQPLIITAPAAPGGGWDQTARAMQRVFAVVEPGVSVQVDNVPGAAGTIGLARFIQSERGNPSALLITGLVMMSGVIINRSPVSLADTTPIARLTGEYEVIVVPASSPILSIGGLVDAFKRNPGAVSWGGGSAGGTDDLLVRLLAEQSGLPASAVNYIAYSGGGAALAAVLGGQLTAAVSGYAEFAGQIEAGQLRALAISSAARVPGIDAPTLRESGIALDLANWRAIVAPPGLSAVEQDTLTTRVTRLASSAEWRTLLAQNGWDNQFLTGAPLRQFLLAEHARMDEVLGRLSATDSSSPRRIALALTPMTIPLLVAWIFAAVFAIGGVHSVRRWRALNPMGLRMTVAILLALVLLPLTFTSMGFVTSSTIVFVLVSTAMRGLTPTLRRLGGDALIGAVLSTLLYVAFTRGLGVGLPGLPF